MQTQYEIVNKETGETYQVRGLLFGNSQEQNVTVTTDIGNVVFENKDQMGVLTNERYEIREIASN